MKNVQISEELFVAIMRYFMLEQEELLPQIKQGLEKKLDAMVMRELYTKYKTAPPKTLRHTSSIQIFFSSLFLFFFRWCGLERVRKGMVD